MCDMLHANCATVGYSCVGLILSIAFIPLQRLIAYGGNFFLV